jgi:hypothetical protein
MSGDRSAAIDSDAFAGQVHDLPSVAPRAWPRLVVVSSSVPRVPVPAEATVAPAEPAVPIGIDPAQFTEPCPGRVLYGDVLLFAEKVLGGTFDRPVLLGHRRIMGQVVGANAGPDRRQSHFTVEVFASEGCEPLAAGTVVRRKAADISRWTTRRRPWADEAERALLLERADEALPLVRKARRLPRREIGR